MKESPKNTCNFCSDENIMTPQKLEATHWWNWSICIVVNPDGSHELLIPGDDSDDTYIDIEFCPMCGRKLRT